MILASRPRFRASGRPPGPRLSAVPAGISHNGFPGFWDCWVLGFLGSPSRSQGNSARGSGGSIPPCRFPLSRPVLESQRGSSMRVPGLAARLANQPPSQSPPRLAPRTIYGNMLHHSGWHRKVRPQSSWWPSAGRTTRKTFSRDWKKSIEEISPREWEKFQERHPETISIGKRERGAEPG